MSTSRVMVVTEDSALRKVLTGLLEECRFDAFPATDCLDALRQVYHVAPQVLISDTDLYPYGGFEFLPFVRHRFPEIGVIALVRNHERGRGQEIVADAIVPVEPFNPRLLASSLAGVSARFPFRQEGEVPISNLTAFRRASEPKERAAGLAKTVSPN